jgi:hypothetical protein
MDHYSDFFLFHRLQEVTIAGDIEFLQQLVTDIGLQFVSNEMKKF